MPDAERPNASAGAWGEVFGFDAAALARAGERRAGWGALVSDRLDDAEIRAAAGLAPEAEPPSRLEALCLRALVADARGDAGAALELAREAFRAADAVPVLELRVLAALVLARLRRKSGRPHLALHILRALGEVAPPEAQAWLRWEMLLAGAALADGERPAAAGGPATPADRGLAALVRLLTAARDGDGTGFAAAATALLEALGAAGPLGQEAGALIAALGPDRDGPSAIAAWQRGEEQGAPMGLYATGAEGVPAEYPVYVLARPKGGARRVLRAGLPLAPEAVKLVTAPEARDADRAGTRTATAIAVTALAGPQGLERDAFFRAVYGFGFKGDQHRGVLETLILRMRTALADAGVIQRVDGTIALEVQRPFVVPDPRCALAVTDRVLRSIAELGMPSAAEAANALGLPLRTVQAALQQLVGEGACQARREGRHMTYRVEDTTFRVWTQASRPQPA